MATKDVLLVVLSLATLAMVGVVILRVSSHESGYNPRVRAREPKLIENEETMEWRDYHGNPRKLVMHRVVSFSR